MIKQTAFDPHQQYAQPVRLMLCRQCHNSLSPYDAYIEFDADFYHIDCFRCKSCNTMFSTNRTDGGIRSIKDDQGYLYCPRDFISCLQCRICLNNSDLKSNIFEIISKTKEQLLTPPNLDVSSYKNNDTILIHVECACCISCKATIKPESEYSLDDKSDHVRIYCHRCKRAKSKRHRLSSRQKELFLDKYHAASDKDRLDEGVMRRWSNEIGCTFKSLAIYTRKNRDKMTAIKISTQQYTLLDSVQLVDKITAPNQRPAVNFFEPIGTFNSC